MHNGLLDFSVTLEGKESSTLKIVGNIVKGGLELLSVKTEEQQKCINFGAVYFGTDNTESAYLFNNSPESVNFISVLNQGVAGEEMVNYINFYLKFFVFGISYYTKCLHYNLFSAFILSENTYLFIYSSMLVIKLL